MARAACVIDDCGSKNDQNDHREPDSIKHKRIIRREKTVLFLLYRRIRASLRKNAGSIHKSKSMVNHEVSQATDIAYNKLLLAITAV